MRRSCKPVLARPWPLVGGLRESIGRAVLCDYVGHIGQASTALGLAACGPVNGGRRCGSTGCHQFIDSAVVQGVADADEQGSLPICAGISGQREQNARAGIKMQLRIGFIRLDALFCHLAESSRF